MIKFIDWIKTNPLAVVTLFMVVGTFWLGWETYQLKLVDLGPHIDIEDVSLQILDNTGSIIKDRSWLEGEKINPNASPQIPKEALLSIKFSNSGKETGYVELLNYQDIIKNTCSGGGNSEAFIGGRLSVSGGGETGWSYPVNIISWFNKVGFLDLLYKFATYNINGEKIEERNVGVRCEIVRVSENSLNPGCKIIYPPEKEQEQIYNFFGLRYSYFLIGLFFLISIISFLSNKRNAWRILFLDLILLILNLFY